MRQHRPRKQRNNAHRNVRRNGQQGFSLLYIMFILLALSTLATSMASFTQNSSVAQFNQNTVTQARYMALAGLNYVRQYGDDYSDLQGQTFSFGNAGQFTVLTANDSNPQNTMAVRAQVQGTVHSGTRYEANYIIDDTFLRESQRAITFREDFDDFGGDDGDPITSNSPVITKNNDNTFTIGSNVNYSFGAMYYTGTKSLNYGSNTCVEGVCEVKYGFRMFFVSTYEKNDADGLVFTWFNSLYNFIAAADSGDGKAKYAVGGSSELGEMMGYAGDGRVYSGSNGTYGTGEIEKWVVPELNSGIQVPKMGVEFDNYANTGTGSICSDEHAQPSTSQRADTSTDHIAYVFWGNETDSGLDCAYWWKQVGSYYHKYWIPYKDSTDNIGATYAGAYSFDDNRHGTGNNPSNSDSAGYWETNFTWTDRPFAFRLEVERDIDTGEYTLTSWLRQCAVPGAGEEPCTEYFQYDEAFPDNDDIYFSDTSRFLCDGGSDFVTGKCSNFNTPILKKSITLTAAQHAAMEDIIFGFTTATGGSTQIATFSEFIFQFIKSSDYDSSGLKRRVIDYSVD